MLDAGASCASLRPRLSRLLTHGSEHEAGRAPPPRVKRAAGLCALAIIVATASAGLVGASPAQAADPVVEAVLAPENGALSRPGEPLTLSGSVTNVSSAPLPAGTLDVAVQRGLSGEEELAAAFADPSSVSARVLATVETPQIPPSGSAQLSVEIPAAVLDAELNGAGWGAHVVVTTMKSGSEVSSTSATALVRLDGDAPATVDVSVVVPITTPASGEALISAETLEQYTAPSGLLSRKLQAASNPAAVIALDPRVLASIRVLGSSAPQSALDWLERLEQLPNEVFPLQYGDADLALERSIGAGAPLAPLSFLSALRSDDFATPEPTPTSTISPSPTNEPSPSPTVTTTPTAGPDGEPQLPTMEQLLAFDYSGTDFAWPSANHASAADLDFAGAAGLGRVLVAESNLTERVPGPVASVEGRNVVVADSASSAVSQAVFAVGTADSRLAQSRAAAELAAVASDSDGAQQSIVVALDRAGSTSSDMATALSAITSLPWVGSAAFPVADAAATGDAGWATAADDRAGTAAFLLTDEAAIAQFATVLDQPELLTGPARNELLAVLSAEWADDPTGWTGTAAAQRDSTAKTLSSVTVDASSQINVAAFTADAPIYVTNTLPYPVNVNVTPRANNGRLVITGASATVPPESTQRVLLQAKAIANGRVIVTVDLTSPVGVPIGDPRYIQLDVQPFWETAGIAVIGVLVAGLLGFGTYRSIRRRRRARADSDGAA